MLPEPLVRLIAHADGRMLIGDRAVRCAVGRAGVVPASAKIEGDGASPAGLWPLRHVYFRPDRIEQPVTRLPVSPLTPSDGWCDEPTDPNYNRPVALPYDASAERLWRDDGVYDLIVVLGYNDDPVRPGAGSAIFLHLASEDYGPTQGCIALSREDLTAVLAESRPGDALLISHP